jgi:hypothetical protein
LSLWTAWIPDAFAPGSFCVALLRSVKYLPGEAQFPSSP